MLRTPRITLSWFVLSALVLCCCLAGCSEEQRAITSLEELQHSRLGVMTGSVGEQSARERYPAADIQLFDDIMDAVTALSAGQLDGVLTAETTARQILKRNPDLTILDGYLRDEPAAVGLRKGDDLLREGIDGILVRLQADGTLADMSRRWFKSDLSPYVVPEIAVPTTGRPLRVGVSATREPMSFLDAEGQISGHDGELARRIAAGLGRPLEFFNSHWASLLPALQSGRIDAIVSGMTATEERRRLIDFSAPYFRNRQVVMAHRPGIKDQALGLAAIEDLHGLRIATGLGTAQDFYFTKNYPDSTILRLTSSADMVQAMLSDRVDAAVGDTEPIRRVMRENPQLGPIGEPILPFPVAVAFRQDNDALRTQFNDFLAAIEADGTHADMKARWLDGEDPDMPDIAGGNPANGTLVAGIDAFGLPFIALRDGEFVGFDVELLQRFAHYIDKDIRFDNIEFSGLIAAVVSGRVDVIAASIFVTEERKKSVDFSDPYYESTSTVYALKKNIAGQESAERAPAAGALERLAASFENNIIAEKRYLLIIDGLQTTIVISVLATLFGTVLGAVVCAMRMSAHGVAQWTARIFITTMRGTPVLVFLMILFYVVFASAPISPVGVAIIAFGIHFAAYVSEMFRTAIESIDPGQQEAGISMGFSRTGAFTAIVLPQALQRVLPVYKGEFLSLVKTTSIVGYIAVQDLTKAGDLIRSRTFDAFFPLVMIAVLYFAVSWALMQSLEYLERRTDPRRRRRQGGRS